MTITGKGLAVRTERARHCTSVPHKCHSCDRVRPAGVWGSGSGAGGGEVNRHKRATHWHSPSLFS